MVADSVVRLLVRDAYSAAYVEETSAHGSNSDYAAGEYTLAAGEDVDDYGVELTLRDALMAELIQSEYFADDDYGEGEEDYMLLYQSDEASDSGLDQAWADYLEDAYEYINYGYYDEDDEEVSALSLVSAFGRYYAADVSRASLRQDAQDLGGASELVAWTQNGELVLALLPRFSSADEQYEQYLPGEPRQGVHWSEGMPFPGPPLVAQLDWALVNRDGRVNWGLVTLCLLAGGTLAMLVGFVASWLALRRTMGRRHVYVPFMLCPSGKGERCMLAAPLLEGDDGHGCGGKQLQLDVEYAAAHVDADRGSNESVAKALYK